MEFKFYLHVLRKYYIFFTLIGKTNKSMDEKILRKFLSKGELSIRHVRCIIVGIGGAGKTTLLRRLQNAKFKDLKDIKKTELVDVYVNCFEVLEEQNTIQSKINECVINLLAFVIRH